MAYTRALCRNLVALVCLCLFGLVLFCFLLPVSHGFILRLCAKYVQPLHRHHLKADSSVFGGACIRFTLLAQHELELLHKAYERSLDNYRRKLLRVAILDRNKVICFNFPAILLWCMIEEAEEWIKVRVDLFSFGLALSQQLRGIVVIIRLRSLLFLLVIDLRLMCIFKLVLQFYKVTKLHLD